MSAGSPLWVFPCSSVSETAVIFLPASGNRNDSSLGGAGSYGGYWSSSLNESNPNNAYNLNFNSSNVDWNNNNRYNGRSVRPVCVSSALVFRYFLFCFPC